jgi:hypothetical protein
MSTTEANSNNKDALMASLMGLESSPAADHASGGLFDDADNTFNNNNGDTTTTSAEEPLFLSPDAAESPTQGALILNGHPNYNDDDVLDPVDLPFAAAPTTTMTSETTTPVTAASTLLAQSGLLLAAGNNGAANHSGETGGGGGLFDDIDREEQEREAQKQREILEEQRRQQEAAAAELARRRAEEEAAAEQLRLQQQQQEELHRQQLAQQQMQKQQQQQQQMQSQFESVHISPYAPNLNSIHPQQPTPVVQAGFYRDHASMMPQPASSVQPPQLNVHPSQPPRVNYYTGGGASQQQQPVYGTPQQQQPTSPPRYYSPAQQQPTSPYATSQQATPQQQQQQQLTPNAQASMHNIHLGLGVAATSPVPTAPGPVTNSLYQEITITHPLLIQGTASLFGFKQAPHWSYQLNTRLSSSDGGAQLWLVRRRFRHVVALEDRLRQECPGAILPPR